MTLAGTTPSSDSTSSSFDLALALWQLITPVLTLQFEPVRHIRAEISHPKEAIAVPADCDLGKSLPVSVKSQTLFVEVSKSAR